MSDRSGLLPGAAVTGDRGGRLDDPIPLARLAEPPRSIGEAKPSAGATITNLPSRPGLPAPAGESRIRLDPRLRLAWRTVAGGLALLGLVSLLRAVLGGSPVDMLVALLVVVVAGAIAVAHRLVTGLEAERRSEAESFSRVLVGLSRSVSPDAIVAAIVEELGAGTGADHIVVARRSPGNRLLEATLVATRGSLPVSNTILPITDLDDPLDDGGASMSLAAARRRRMAVIRIEADAGEPALARAAASPDGDVPPAERRRGPRPPHATPIREGAPDRIAGRIADRVRDVYGLKHTLSAPLRIDGRVEGAIVLSRRIGSWPDRSRRLLDAAAVEASAALARAYSHRAAEARASTDALTGLPNRRYFDEYVALLARRRRADDRVGLLMVDVDRFKRINDTLGHATGDQVLRAVASAIARTVREDDVPARFGGEEFVVLLRNPTLDVAVEVAERVRRAVGELDLRGLGVPGVSVSIGVAVAARPEVALERLIADADAALYRAKRAGRDRVIAA